MAGNRIVYTLDFKANFNDVQGQLNTLRKSLSEVASMRIGENGFGAQQLQKASDAALMLQKHLKTALDPNTGKLDLSRLQTQLRLSGQSARQLALDLVSVGPKGAQSFMQITNAVINAQKPMMRLGSIATKLGATLMNTVRWQISSRALYGFIGAFSNALNYAKELDKTLNHIQRVTGDSKASMDAFAVSANKAAKELSASTKQVAEATLIYRQQGDSAVEAAKKAQITIKAAHAAGTEAKEMSQYLTGIWNSYRVGTKQLELFVDKLVKIGAVTATSAEEMATSMTKVAATANAVGVTYDQLLATISTVSAATRVSAEQVGTAFKTIYARMGDLSLEGSVKEGDLTTTLGAVSGVIDQVGIKVFEANGQLRDTGAIVEDIGNKWAVLDVNQKTAIAEALAGKRQYTQLFALFENWDEYNRALTEAGKAQGELNRQQGVYSDSVEGAKARLKAEKEEFQIQLFDPDMVQGFIEAITIILSGFNDMVEAADGLGNVLFMIGGLLVSKFAPQIANGIGNVITGVIATLPFAGERAAKKFVQQWHAAFNEIRGMSVFSSPIDQATLNTMEQMMMLQQDINKAGKEMTDIEKQKLDIIMNEAKAKQESLATSRAEVAEAEKLKKTAQENIMGATGKTSFASLGMKQGFFDMSKQGFDPAVSNLLFQGLNKSKVTIQEMTANLNNMEANMREVALIDIARVFNDGKWPTETLVNNVRSLFDAETQVLEQTYNFNQKNAEANSIVAELQTKLTGIVHIYDKEAGAVVNINDKVLEWKKHLESGNNLLEQRKKKEEEILQLQAKRGSTAFAKNGNISRDRFITQFDGIKKEDGQNVVGKDRRKVLGAFFDQAQNGAVDSKTMGGVQNLISDLSKVKGPLGENNAALEKFKTLVQEVGKGTVGLDKLKKEWQEIDDKIKKATMGQEEFFNSHANVPQGGVKPETPKTTKELRKDLKTQKETAYKARKDANAALKNADPSLMSAKSAEDVDKILKALPKQKQLLKENQDAADKLKKALNAEAEVNKTKEKLQSLRGGIKQFGTGVTQTIGGVSSLFMSVSMIGSSLSTIGDESKTTAEKMMAWGMLLTSVTTALNGAKSVFNGLQTISNALLNKEIVKKRVQIIQSEMENASLIKKIALYIKLALAKNPYAAAAVAVVAATAAIIAFGKETSEAEKQERRFNAAAKQLEEGMKEQEALEKEVSNLEELGEKLREAREDTQALANVTKELNETLGINVNLVSGGSIEYEKANTALEKQNKLKQQQLEIQRKQNLEDAKIKLASITAKSSGKGAGATSDKINSEQARKVYQKFLSLDKEKRDKIMYEGGTLTVDLGGDLDNEDFQIDQLNDIKEKFSTTAKETMDLISPNLSLAFMDQQSLIDSAQFDLDANEFVNFIDVLDQNQTTLNEAIMNRDSEMVISIMNGLFTSSEATNEIIESEKEKILKMIDEDREEIAKLKSQEKTRSQINTDAGPIKTLGGANKTLVEAFNENGEFTDKEIQEYLEKAKNAAQLSEMEIEALENELLDPALTEAKLGALMDNVTSRILNNADLMKDASTDTAQVIKILENSGIANATETANRMKNIYELVTKDQERYTDTFKKTGIAVNVFEDEIAELQSQYGMTAEEATSLVAQQNIIANTDLNIDEKIIALRQYAYAFDGVNNAMAVFLHTLDTDNKITQWDQIDSSKIDMIEDLGYKKGDNGEIINTRTGKKVEDLDYDIAATRIELQSRVDFELEYIAQSKKERDKLIEEHNKAIRDWEKDNILEHIKDSILELEKTIEKFNRKTASLDFTKNLFGEDTPIDVYIQKVENFKNITKASVENWDELMSMEADTAEEMEEILAAKESTLETWRQSILDAKEAEDQLYDAKIQLVEEAGTGLTNVIEKQHELISVTLEGMQNLLDLNESGGSDLTKKGALAKMIGQVAGALSEYDKEIREQERASKKRLDIRNEETQQILEMNQRMEDEINKYALDALKQGIVDRQAERDLERQEIIKDFNETANAIDARISESYNKLEETYGPFIERLDEYMSVSSGKVSMIAIGDDKYEYHKDFGYATDAKYDELLDDGSKVTEVGSNFIKVKAKGDNGKYENEYTYTFSNTKSGEAPEIQVKEGQEIDKNTVLASNTTGYVMTSTKQLGETQAKRFGLEQDPNKLHWRIKSVETEDLYGSDGWKITLENKEYKGTHEFKYTDSVTHYGDLGTLPRYIYGGDTIYLPVENNEVKESAFGELYYVDDDHDYTDNLLKIGSGEYYDAATLKNYFGTDLQFAKGADSTPAGEAWVGELGRELIILPDGKVVMAGEDGIELANLPAGARVLTNEETEKILKNKKDYTNVQDSEVGFAQGTQFHVNEQNLTQETVDFNAEYFNEDVENYKTATDEKLNIQDTFKKETNQTLSDIESATIQKNKEIKDNTTTTLSALDTITQSTSSKIEGYINNMSFVIPKIDSKEFLDSLEKLVDDSLRVVYEDQDITITDESGQTHTGKYSSGGIGGSELGEIRGSSVEIGQGITTYDDLFVKHGKAYGIDPRFLKAICGIETNFGKNVNTSSAGAKGLMQFIDSTAKAYGVDVTNPDSSVRGAAQYLSELLAKYNGDLILAGRAYNGGTPNKSRENLNYGKMLEECFGKNTTNESLLKTSKIRVNSFAELLAHIAGLNTNFIEEDGWIDPVLNGYISSDYQPQGRYNKQTGKTRPHMGVDIATASNSAVPLYATKDGIIVTNQFDDGGYGNWVRFKTDDGYLVGYGHMLNLSPYKVGSRIKQGDIIGYMGSTGLSSGVHLDYHVQKDNSYIDPKTVMPSYAVGGVTKSGKALVGEYGKEIILYPDGTAGLLGENGMEYADLPAGAHIIPAEETAKILNNPVDKRIPAYAEGTELNLNTLSMEKDYLKVTLSPEEVSYLKKIYNIIDDVTDEISSELHEALQNRATEMGYSTLRDVLAETFGYENLAKRDFKNYKKSMMNVEGFEYIQGLERDYLTQVFSPDEIVFLKSLFKLEDTSETVTDELHATMQGRAKDRGYGTLRDVGVEIYGAEGILKREWESGYSTKYSIEQLKALTDDVATSFREFYGDEIISNLLNLWKLDPSSEEFEIETDRQDLDTIFKSRDFYQQQVDELVAQLETYEDLVARGIIARNDEYRAILSKAIEETGGKLEDIDSQFQSRLDTKITALENYFEEYRYYYNRLIEDENRLIETLEGRKGVWETYYGEYNELLDTQHSINKELQKSKTLTQWLDAKTREQVFNEKDYLQYTQMINEHMLEAEKDRLKYEREIKALGEYESEKIALITEEYQERVELRKKELNILKEELQLQKKQNALNTALMERNVRVFSGGRWIQIANVENVAKAQEELEDTKYNISKAERELDQTEHLNNDFNEEIRKSKEIIADWNAALAEAEDKMNHSIHELTSTIDIGKGSFKDLFDEIDSVIKQSEIEKEAFEKGGAAPKTIKSSSGGGSVKNSSGGRNYAEEMYILKLEAEAASKAGDTEMFNKAHAEANKIREELGQSDYGANENAEEFKKNYIDKNASGTRDSQSGFSLVNEKGVEMLSTKYGQIIELNPHQKIFNNDQLNYLYDISREGIAGMSRTVSAMTANSNMVSIDTLHIALDNVTNAESFIDGLKNLNQYIKNTRTINRS